MTKLFLDDIRYPHWIYGNDSDWALVRTVDEAIRWIRMNNFPEAISFDHDLGMKDGKELPSGFDFAVELINMDIDNEIDIPLETEFLVHSSNPPGAENIRKLLENYMKFKMEQSDGI